MSSIATQDSAGVAWLNLNGKILVNMHWYWQSANNTPGSQEPRGALMEGNQRLEFLMQKS
jgi:hypothetical protein